MSGTTYELTYLGPDPLMAGETFPVQFDTQVASQAGQLLSIVNAPRGSIDVLQGDVMASLVITEYFDGFPVGSLDYPDASVSLLGSTGNGADDVYEIDGFGTVTGVFDPYVPCFVTGTRIATPAGRVPVEDFRPGDTIELATGGTAAVIWIGHRRVQDGFVVRIHPGALPIGPDRNLYVSRDHAMFIDGSLVPAGLLVDGENIVLEHRDVVTFWHVELETHGVLLADGAPAESYLDTGNRQQYGNCPVRYDPVSATQDACAEMILAGSRLGEIRSMITTRVAA